MNVGRSMAGYSRGFVEQQHQQPARCQSQQQRSDEHEQ